MNYAIVKQMHYVIEYVTQMNYVIVFVIFENCSIISNHKSLSEYHGESNPVPANPFMEEARAQQQVSDHFHTDFLLAIVFFQPANLLDLASDLLNRITARRSLNVYRIANSRGAVGSFSISKSSYKLGEDIVASFDFRFVIQG